MESTKILRPLILKQHTIGTGLFTCWGVEDDSLIMITSGVTKLIERFGNVWLDCIRDLTQPPRKKFHWLLVKSNMKHLFQPPAITD